jgi:lysophospholipase L1-like esterase
LLAQLRPKSDTTVTATSSTTSDATLGKAYNYLADKALFTLYGGQEFISTGGNVAVKTIPVVGAGNIGTGMSQGVGRLAFMTNAPSVELCVGSSSTFWRAYVDGVPANDPTAYASTAGMNFNKLVFAASPAGRRVDFEWEQNGSFFGGNGKVTTLRIPQGSDVFGNPYTIWAVDASKRLRIVFDADSYGSGTGATSQILGFAMEFGRALGGMDLDIWACGWGGSGYTVANGNYTAADPTRMDWVATTAAPDILITALGINDASAAAATIQAAVLTSLQGKRTRAPNTPLITLGSWPGAQGPGASIIAAENAIKAGVNQFADPNAPFLPVSTDFVPWIYGTGHVGATNGSGNSDWAIWSGDTTHPSNDGHRWLGRGRLVPAVRSVLPYLRRP